MKPSPRRNLLGILLLVASAPLLTADTITLVGPTLDGNTTNWHSAGLQVTALETVTLDSFVWHGLGEADTISLTDSYGNVLHSTSFSAPDVLQNVTAGWVLTAGSVYHLISQDDGKWAPYNGPRVANSHIRVDGAWAGDGWLEAGYWMFFTDLTTSDAVPEPSTLALSGGAFALLGLARRRVRRSIHA